MVNPSLTTLIAAFAPQLLATSLTLAAAIAQIVRAKDVAKQLLALAVLTLVLAEILEAAFAVVPHWMVTLTMVVWVGALVRTVAEVLVWAWIRCSRRGKS